MTKAEFVLRVRQMERRLYRISRSMLLCNADCEDAVQEALLKGWLRLESLKQPQYFETWLIRILINECRNLYRRRRIAEVEFRENLDVADPETPQLYDALMSLPQKYRILLELHYIEGYKTREIAKMMGMPESTVKWRLVYGRRELKRQLGEEA